MEENYTKKFCNQPGGIRSQESFFPGLLGHKVIINLYMGTEPSPSMILDTDYESFAASYSCENHPLELTHKKTASIDTRDPNPSQETVSITSLTNLAAICTCYRSRSTKHSRHLRATVWYLMIGTPLRILMTACTIEVQAARTIGNRSQKLYIMWSHLEIS